MRKSLFVLLVLLAGSVTAAPLPDNIFFRAMQDEMQRTQKELRVPGSPKPFFTAYKIIYSTSQNFEALFGVPYAREEEPKTNLTAMGYIYAGTARTNSSGFDNDMYYYRPLVSSAGPLSYEGLRRLLWRLTDSEYIFASTSYERKEAYKRQKNIIDPLPDFTASAKASYVQDIPAFPKIDAATSQKLVEELSALGKELSYLEFFSTALQFAQQDIYFLDSEGDFYQYSIPLASFSITARLRNQDGYKENIRQNWSLPWEAALNQAELKEWTEQFLQELQDMYQARKAEPYLGPVLLEPKAAGGFFNQLFISNANNPKPLLSAQRETDTTAGQFKDKMGLRVISHLLDVYDRPHVREYENIPLQAFMPIDDEGVEAEELKLVQSGKLLGLPGSRSPISGQKRSNGHARFNSRTYPRAMLSNVFFTPKNPLSTEELEQKLLARCQELELEYCYIFPRFPVINGGKGELDFAWRIYTDDGRKEPVYGLRLEGVTTRSLRDVSAAADDMSVSHFVDNRTQMPFSVIAPSVLVDEIEILPTQRKPDRKPFVPLP